VYSFILIRRKKIASLSDIQAAQVLKTHKKAKIDDPILLLKWNDAWIQLHPQGLFCNL
jgi:hypothetical protein